MKKALIAMSAISLAAFIAFTVSYVITEIPTLLPFAITFGTIFYHPTMRLIVGHLIDLIFRNKMNYKRWWFRAHKGEEKFFKFLRVHKWKKAVPTYAPETFDISKGLEHLIMATCQAEVVHEVIMLLSFLPIICTIFFGEFWVFFATSVVACLIDSVFVILQRYNRPRLLRIQERQNSHQNNN